MAETLAAGERPEIALADRLSCDERKRRIYADDTFFKESLHQLTELTSDLGEFFSTTALLLLKPDAVAARKLLPSLDWLADNGFRVVASGPSRLDRLALRALWYYQWNIATPQRRRLADYLLTSTDSLVVVVRSATGSVVPAPVRLTELKGPTDPASRTPGQLRYLLGRYTYLLNMAHTADEPADVIRELGIYFDTDRRGDIYTAALDGRDRMAEARALANEIHEQSPERDISFDGATARLGQALEAFLAGQADSGENQAMRAALETAGRSPLEGWREILELADRHGFALDTWDAAIVGTSVWPMREPGLGPVLDGVSPADWERHAAQCR